ncbi:MAG: putative membrane protein, partial [Arenicella sp.]
MKGYKKLDILILLLLLILQLVISVPFIDSYPIELDEPFTIYHSSRPLSETIPMLLEGNNPPLHYVLQHFWQGLLGIEPAAVRSFSLLISLIFIAVIYLFVLKR